MVKTNAHVAGTDKNRNIVVEVESLGRKRLTGRIVEVMYNRNQIAADWALLHVPNLTEVEPVYLTKGLPAKGESLYTKGFPKCVAHAGTDITQFQTINNGVLLWLPNAIGGQSGSGVWGDDDHLMKALLTWSIRQGNRWYGGGQLTNTIYDQMRGQVVQGYPRPRNWEFVELTDPVDYDSNGLDDPTLQECYWTTRAASEMWPIWAEDQLPGSGGDGNVDPQPGNNRAGIESLRKVRDLADAEIKRLEQGIAKPVDPTDDKAIEETFGL